MNVIQMIGGPLDGVIVPNDGYFKEGDIEGVDTCEFAGTEWSKESVYRVTNGQLVYDPEATKKRREIVESETRPTAK